MSRLAVITDEISEDLAHALAVCTEIGISDVELRSIDGTSIVDHTEARLTEIAAMLADGGFQVVNIASPFLKTHIGEDASPIGNVHSATARTREQHWDVLKRSLEIADMLDAPMVRAFSFWRVEQPESVREDILATLATATAIAKEAGKILGLENEHACNIGSGIEAAWYLERIPDSALGLIWDPGNIAALGQLPDRAQYNAIAARIAHVHVKDADAIPFTALCRPDRVCATGNSNSAGCMQVATMVRSAWKRIFRWTDRLKPAPAPLPMPPVSLPTAPGCRSISLCPRITLYTC